MSELLGIVVFIFVIYILAKFMKPILKACVSIVAIVVMLAFTIGLIFMFKIYGGYSFLILLFLIFSVICEVIALIYAILKKISSWWG